MLDVVSHLIPERAALLEVLHGLDGDGWSSPTECPGWTVHELALHVLGDDLSLLARQRDDGVNGLILYAEDHPGLGFRGLLDGFNEQWVAGARFFSHRLVCTLLELTGEWTAAFYGSVDLEAIGPEPVGFYAASALSPWWQVVAREYCERWIHQQQIRRAVGARDVASAVTGPAIEAVVEGFGARIADLGSFRIGDRAWRFGSGSDEVALDAAAAIPVLSRALPLDDTISALQGPPALVETVARQTFRDL